MSSASGYMGEKYFQEFGPRFLTCLQAKKKPVHISFRLISSFRLMTSRSFRLVLAGNVYHSGLGPDPPDCGNLESTKFPNMKILKIKIRSAQNVGKVWISRRKQKKKLPALFGTI